MFAKIAGIVRVIGLPSNQMKKLGKLLFEVPRVHRHIATANSLSVTEQIEATSQLADMLLSKNLKLDLG